MGDAVMRAFDDIAAVIESRCSMLSPPDRQVLRSMVDHYLASLEAPVEVSEAAAAKVAFKSRLHKNLQRARRELLALVPYGSIAEAVAMPPSSPQFDATVPFYDVDAFLFDEEDLDGLVEAGVVHRYYCANCRSSDGIRLTQFISHSFNETQLAFLGERLLPFMLQSRRTSPTASEFNVVDVGSRLGIVVATAAWSLMKLCRESNLSLRCTGVELCEDYCQVQRRFFEKVSLRHPMVSIVQGDATAAGTAANAALVEADVIIMNNVFEWFVPFEEQLDKWRIIRQSATKRGQFILTLPSLESTLEPLFSDAAHNGAEHHREAKEHRCECDSRAHHLARRFVEEWAERVDITSLREAFLEEGKTQEDNSDRDASPSEAEHTAELLGMMSLYKVK